MKTSMKVLGSMVAVALAAFSGAAHSVDEAESNNFLSSAQQLSADSDLSIIAEGAAINGTIAPPSPYPDVDFYTFYATANQTLTLHIQDETVTPVLTVISPSHKIKAEKIYDGNPVRLDDLLLDETGMWAVVVTPFKVLIGDPQATEYGTLFASGSALFSPTSGSYTLVLTPGAPASPAPPAEPSTPAAPAIIGIEIKPGSGERAPINPKAKGVIPVALLASPGFDPFNIEVNSLTFGATGDEQTLRRCAAGGQDVDGDGDLDRVCTFENQGTQFNETSTMGILKGHTTAGSAFQAQGFLKAVPSQGKP
ncbi:MAG TPA: hypothetical protein VFC18_18130 [Burkholderiales bacterium]|nr:hypothetical protein [Burkholderiales bacterium]